MKESHNQRQSGRNKWSILESSRCYFINDHPYKIRRRVHVLYMSSRMPLRYVLAYCSFTLVTFLTATFFFWNYYPLGVSSNVSEATHRKILFLEINRILEIRIWNNSFSWSRTGVTRSNKSASYYCKKYVWNKSCS